MPRTFTDTELGALLDAELEQQWHALEDAEREATKAQLTRLRVDTDRRIREALARGHVVSDELESDYNKIILAEEVMVAQDEGVELTTFQAQILPPDLDEGSDEANVEFDRLGEPDSAFHEPRSHVDAAAHTLAAERRRIANPTLDVPVELAGLQAPGNEPPRAGVDAGIRVTHDGQTVPDPAPVLTAEEERRIAAIEEERRRAEAEEERIFNARVREGNIPVPGTAPIAGEEGWIPGEPPEDPIMSLEPAAPIPEADRVDPADEDEMPFKHRLTPEQYAVWKQNFADEECGFYDVYNEAIKAIVEEGAGKSFVHGKTHNYRKQMEGALGRMEFMQLGAEQQYKELEKEYEQTKDSLDEAAKEALEKRRDAAKAHYDYAKKCHDVAIVTLAMTNQHTSLSEAELNKHLDALSNIRGIDPEDAEDDELTQTLKDFYKKGVGSTGVGSGILGRDEYDSADGTKRIGDRKVVGKGVAVTISQDKRSVEARFSYNKNALLGTTPFGLKDYTKLSQKFRGGSAKDTLESQVHDFVSIAIYQANKGTAENPVNIKPGDPPQNEAAVAIIKDLKNRAMTEGREFYCVHNGQTIVITPNPKLSEQELAYMEHYASQKSHNYLVNFKGKGPIPGWRFKKTTSGSTAGQNMGMSKKEGYGKSWQHQINEAMAADKVQHERSMDKAVDWLHEVDLKGRLGSGARPGMQN